MSSRDNSDVVDFSSIYAQNRHARDEDRTAGFALARVRTDVWALDDRLKSVENAPLVFRMACPRPARITSQASWACSRVWEWAS